MIVSGWPGTGDEGKLRVFQTLERCELERALIKQEYADDLNPSECKQAKLVMDSGHSI